eukprot:TRINITY_DN31571_c0_g1_i1.p3 TRINITY_DN31571_c0_g1~~TRINITY_DN31571_c0_g1_i1.p3  ORF type:complete len:151 (+),score=35.38 TRINITY_DN31571_c0_g1_i1:49-501(+)
MFAKGAGKTPNVGGSNPFAQLAKKKQGGGAGGGGSGNAFQRLDNLKRGFNKVAAAPPPKVSSAVTSLASAAAESGPKKKKQKKQGKSAWSESPAVSSQRQAHSLLLPSATDRPNKIVDSVPIEPLTSATLLPDKDQRFIYVGPLQSTDLC